MKKNAKTYYTASELAKVYGVDRQAVYKWEKTGLKSVKIAGVKKFDAAEVEGFLQARQLISNRPRLAAEKKEEKTSRAGRTTGKASQKKDADHADSAPKEEEKTECESADDPEVKERCETLEREIQRMEDLQDEIYAMAKNYVKSKDLVKLNAQLKNLAANFDNIRKAKGDEIKIKKELNILIEKSEAEEVIGIISGCFRVELLRIKSDLPHEIISIISRNSGDLTKISADLSYYIAVFVEKTLQKLTNIFEKWAMGTASIEDIADIEGEDDAKNEKK